jgi:predicted nucleotide-binding protein (sugar kinase/HSP70/actin superfamily)
MKNIEKKLWIAVCLCLVSVQSFVAYKFMDAIKKHLTCLEYEVERMGNALNFDYKIVRINKFPSVADMELKIAFYTGEGWELVSTSTESVDSSHSVVDLIFKREKEN